jgi:hypothetical protein
MPGAAMLEMAAAAVRVLAGDEVREGDSVLVGCALVAPLLLGEEGAGTVVCSVGRAGGDVRIQSARDGVEGRTSHMLGGAGWAAGGSRSGRARAWRRLAGPGRRRCGALGGACPWTAGQRMWRWRRHGGSTARGSGAWRGHGACRGFHWSFGCFRL